MLVKLWTERLFWWALRGSMEHVIGNCTKGDPWQIEAKNLTELCPIVVWKTELVSDKLRYLTKISRQCLRCNLVYYCCV